MAEKLQPLGDQLAVKPIEGEVNKGASSSPIQPHRYK